MLTMVDAEKKMIELAEKLDYSNISDRLRQWDAYRHLLIGAYREAHPDKVILCMHSDNPNGPAFYYDNSSKTFEVLWQDLERDFGPDLAEIRKSFWHGHNSKNND